MFVRNERLQDYIRLFPVTAVFISLNLGWFVYSLIYLDKRAPEHAFGIYDQVKIEAGEWYRLFTAVFTHFDFLHIFLNLVSIYLFASVLERLTAKWKYALIFLGSGFLGYVFVFLFSDARFTVGASGAVFAVFGALFYLSRMKPYLFDGGSRQMLNVMIIINVVATFLLSNISVAGHLGGLLAGFLLSVVLKADQS